MNLTPEEALKHMDAACAKFSGTRDDHLLLQACSGLLQEMIKEWTEMKKQKIPGPKKKGKKTKVAKG